MVCASRSKTPIVARRRGFPRADFYKAIQKDLEGILVEASALAIGPLNDAYRKKDVHVARRLRTRHHH